METRVVEKKINQHVTLVEMPDLVTFDFQVEGDHHYLAHFLNPHYFGKEFAVIGEGPNLFTGKAGEKTECYLFTDAHLRNLVAGVEGHAVEAFMAVPQEQTGTLSPCTGPIIIPPRNSGG